MLWWVLVVFGVSVLVLQWMIFRRQFAFILAGLLLIVGGGLGVAGVWQSGTNPLEQAVEALRRQFPSVIPPSAPANAPVGPSPLQNPEPPTASSPTAPPSSASPTPPSSPNPSELPPMQPESPQTPSPTPPSPTPPTAPQPASPPPATTEPPAATPPPTATPLPERYALEVNANAGEATIKLERADGTIVGSQSAPAKFENLDAGVYTLIAEAPGTKGFRGSVSLPQSKTVTVYLEK